MSPFASRAGTQGITSKSNRNFAQPQRSKGLQGKKSNAMRLSPITQALFKRRSQKSYLQLDEEDSNDMRVASMQLDTVGLDGTERLITEE